MRLFAIGDIHGCLTALQRLDRELGFQADDVVVTLGDYVDRGPDSRGVIDYLIALHSRCQLVSLRGNHEIMMLGARADQSMLLSWRNCGGDTTLGSYGIEAIDEVPLAHWRFIEQTAPYHEADRDFFVHANAYPDAPLSEQPAEMLFWEHFADLGPHRSGRRMICGHTAQKSGRPLNVGHAVCIDTWAYGDGWLTCLETGTGQYWQADKKGGFRAGELG